MNRESKDFFNMSIDELFKQFDSSMSGLSLDKISHNQHLYGKNLIEEAKPKSKTQVFFEQFKDILVIILIVAAIISLFTGGLESTIVIFTVIILNAFLGAAQYFKAEKSLSSLKKLSSPTAKVIRDNQEQVIISSDVVCGDIIILGYGDIVCADCRIIQSNHLEVNESSLTGEGLSVEKNNEVILNNVNLADRKNMAYSGTQVIKGKALGIVVRVGGNTELGKIAALLKNASTEKTPLEHSLDEFSRRLAFLIIAICLAVFFLSIYRRISILDSMMFAVALAVAAIPEALCTIVTIVLAIGTQRMASQKAIVKDLKAVETLGCINVICSDKTGTITQNKMKVRTLFHNNRFLESNLINKTSFHFKNCLLLCNDADYQALDNAIISTDTAIAKMLLMWGINVFDSIKKYKRIDEYTFDSKRKRMSTLHLVNGEYIIYCKGAAEVIIDLCTMIEVNETIKRLTQNDKATIKEAIDILAKRGERVLAVAYKSANIHHSLQINDESNLTFLGLIGLIDPPKEGINQAIMKAKTAGIIPIMITGDHMETAKAIAKEVMIYQEGDEVLSGNKLDKLSDEELDKIIGDVKVYARVSPENKIRIVEAWQRNNANVAFVGDGINDAPAIKKANIGIAMGLSGTEVSKDASGIILMDDNYNTIISAIHNGRNIYNNIQNAICFLMSGNAAGIIMVVATSISGLPIPFAPVHLLFINLLTDSLPAIGIGMEEAVDDVMRHPPRPANVKILNRSAVLKITCGGLLLALFSLLAYRLGLERSPYVARTLAFSTLCVGRLFHSFNCLGRNIFQRRGKKKNYLLFASLIIGLVLVNLALFVPFFQKVLSVDKLLKEEVIALYFCSLAPTIIMQCFQIVKIKNKQK